MTTTRPAHDAPQAERLFEGFENLMPFRVNDILLVSSLYDSFILREDGRLNELLMGESLELDIHQVPGITHVSTGAEAVRLARSQPRFNLIVTNLQVSDMSAAQLASDIKAAGLDVPVVVLAYDYREIKNFIAHNPQTGIERIFLWQGNARILISIVKYIEDKRNVQHDTEAMGVPVMLVVEDDIRYYSLFLPVIYTELISQSRRLLSEGINAAHKLVRMRARPKILLCSDYEEAAEQVAAYREHLFGVVSDVEFPRNGELKPQAGFELARMIRKKVPDVPIVLQSSRAEFMERAHAEEFEFLQKRSPTLLGDLRRILTEQVGFGDFVFRLSDRTEVARAGDLNALEMLLRTVPVESIAYHGERNHFSHWLMARTEFALAQMLRPRKVSDFVDYEHLRRDLIESIAEYRREQNQTLIGEFEPSAFQAEDAFFLRIGGGSLGGKARGLAFIRHLLHQRRIARRYSDIRIGVPATLVLTTIVFDSFLEENDLLDVAIHGTDDEEIVRQFLAAPLPIDLIDKLMAFLAAGALSPGGPLIQPAGRLAVPAFLGCVRDFHAGQPARRCSTAPGAAHGGHQTRLRLHLQPACQGLCASHSLSPGRREDGRRHSAGGGRHPRGIGFIPISRGLCARATSILIRRCAWKTDLLPSPWALDGPWLAVESV